MVLELKDQPANIKQVILAEPERNKVVPFDADREITSTDWENILREFTHFRTIDHAGCIKIVRSIALLSPERLKDLHLDDEFFAYLNKMSHSFPLGNQDWLINELTVKTVFPDKFKHRPCPDEKWQVIKRSPAKDYWSSYFPLLKDIDMLYPQKSIDFTLGEDDKIYLLNTIYNNLQVNKEPRWYAENLTTLKLFWPEEFAKFNIDWDFLRSGLDQKRKENDWYNFAPLAMYMRLIAEDLIITPENIEVVKKQPQLSVNQEPPLPEVKKF